MGVLLAWLLCGGENGGEYGKCCAERNEVVEGLGGSGRNIRQPRGALHPGEDGRDCAGVSFCDTVNSGRWRGGTYSEQRQRHSELTFRAFPRDQKLAS